MVAYTFYESDNRVRRYAETLVKNGYKVEAIVLRRPGQASEERICGVQVYRIQEREKNEKSAMTHLRRLLEFFVRSAAVLTHRHLNDPYDVIHVHSIPDFEVFATLIPRFMGAKVILDIHDIVPELFASKFKVSQQSLMFRLLVWVEKLSVAYSDYVIVANHLWGERIARRSGHAEKCGTILNYPDPAIFHQRPRSAKVDNGFLICYPGTLSSHQGVDLVIRAMGRLGDRAPNLKFLVLGDGGDRDRLLAMTRELGVEDRVTIKGGVPIERVAEIMADVHLGVEPKLKSTFANEALSTKIMEFMAMGVPVLASDTRVHEMYFKADQVQFFESENVDDLAEKILELMHDPARCQAFRERGLDFVSQNNWEVKKQEYLELIGRLVKQPLTGNENRGSGEKTAWLS